MPPSRTPTIPDISTYLQTRRFVAEIADREIIYVSKPGIPDWDSVGMPGILLAENVQIPPHSRLLYLGARHGACAAAIATRFPTLNLLVCDPSILALQAAARTLAANQVNNGQLFFEADCPPPSVQNRFDAICIEVPKGRRLLRRWLAHTRLLLAPGGVVYLAGCNDAGVHTAVKDARSVFGPEAILAYRKGCRVVRYHPATLPEPMPAWLNEPGIAPGVWNEFTVAALSGNLSIRSIAGVFSDGELDPGTALLLEHLPLLSGRTVLDVGCGSGIIGLCAARAGAATVDLVDASLAAVACARENLRCSGFAAGQVLPSDCLEAVSGKQYAVILTNPPFHTGTRVDYAVTQTIIRQSFANLERGGCLRLVANRFIPYPDLLQTVFGNSSLIAANSRFQVLEAIRR
jgi:16S rRNA (guanine1207-N2)-methyltransferase